MRLILYSKPGCHLCAGLQEKLEQIQTLAIDLDVRDITTRDDWFQAYQYEIPVLFLQPQPDQVAPDLQPDQASQRSPLSANASDLNQTLGELSIETGVPSDYAGEPPIEKPVPNDYAGEPLIEKPVPNDYAGEPPIEIRELQTEIGEPPIEKPVPNDYAGEPPIEKPVPNDYAGEPPIENRAPQTEIGELPIEIRELQTENPGLSLSPPLSPSPLIPLPRPSPRASVRQLEQMLQKYLAQTSENHAE